MTLLGWLGSILVVVSLAQSDLRRVRQLNLAASMLLLAFNATLGIAPMILLNAVLVGVNGFHLLRRDLARPDRTPPAAATAAVPSPRRGL